MVRAACTRKAVGRVAVQEQERMRPQVLVGHRARHNGKLQRKRWVPVWPQQR